MAEKIDHPAHYGGKDNPYEAIKVIDAWQLDFSLGNCIKYICRHGKKSTTRPNTLDESIAQRKEAVVDLKKARWYLDHAIAKLEGDH